MINDNNFHPDPTTDDGELFPDWAMTALSLMTRFPEFRPVDMARFGNWDGDARDWVEFVDEVDRGQVPHCADGCSESDFFGGDCSCEWMPWDQARIDEVRANRESEER